MKKVGIIKLQNHHNVCKVKALILYFSNKQREQRKIQVKWTKQQLSNYVKLPCWTIFLHHCVHMDRNKVKLNSRSVWPKHIKLHRDRVKSLQ